MGLIEKKSEHFVRRTSSAIGKQLLYISLCSPVALHYKAHTG